MITSPTRSFWRRPAGFITAAAILLVLLGGGSIALWQLNSSPAAAPTSSQQSPQASTDPSLGVQPYGANTPVDYQKQAAIQARHDYPEYYQCRTYPSDANLTAADLIPTDNVVAVIKYDSHKKKYVVTGDPRITAAEKDSTVPAGGDFTEPTPEQDFTFSFAPGVHYFGMYGADAGQTKWNHGVTLYTTWGSDAKKAFVLPVFDGNQTAHEQYVIIATDTSTCAAGTTPLPDGFDWVYLAKNGLAIPEFATPGVHPQG